eukprot:UN23973
MVLYHGKDVWGPRRNPKTNLTPSGNFWRNEFKKIEKKFSKCIFRGLSQFFQSKCIQVIRVFKHIQY